MWAGAAACFVLWEGVNAVMAYDSGLIHPAISFLSVRAEYCLSGSPSHSYHFFSHSYPNMHALTCFKLFMGCLFRKLNLSFRHERHFTS